METSVKQRLIAFAKNKVGSQKGFEEAVGLSNGYINNISKGIGADKLQRILCVFPDLNQQWLLTGEGEMLNTEKEEPQMQSLPLIPIDAMAGVLTGDCQSIMEYECEHYVMPVFRGANFLIRVQGDSMIPKYLPGDIVACKRILMDNLWFQWGKVYVLDTRQGALIKRIEPSQMQNCIQICSENSQYKPFDLPVEEINALALVCGTIRVD